MAIPDKDVSEKIADAERARKAKNDEHTTESTPPKLGADNPLLDLSISELETSGVTARIVQLVADSILNTIQFIKPCGKTRHSS
jgi:hypothetical protein